MSPDLGRYPAALYPAIDKNDHSVVAAFFRFGVVFVSFEKSVLHYHDKIVPGSLLWQVPKNINRDQLQKPCWWEQLQFVLCFRFTTFSCTRLAIKHCRVYDIRHVGPVKLLPHWVVDPSFTGVFRHVLVVTKTKYPRLYESGYVSLWRSVYRRNSYEYAICLG